MSLSKRVRFDVFKRDEFACQYCGRRVPDVVLEVDHIIPIAEGGGDELENLITSCFDCNRGKGAVPLATRRELDDLGEKAKVLAEREEQLVAYRKVQAQKRAREDAEVARVLDHWYSKWTWHEYAREPSRPSLVRYLDALGPDEIMEAMDIAAAKFSTPRWDAVRYFIGVCRRKVAEQEGRVVACYVCGKRVVLEPGEDPSLSWKHGDCEEPADG